MIRRGYEGGYGVLRDEIIDVLNSGEAWLLVGSGPSIDAGLPRWDALATRAASALEVSQSLAPGHLSEDTDFLRLIEQSAYPRAFRLLEENTSREALEAAVRLNLPSPPSISPLYKELARWPLRGVVTTNYDSLMLRALRDKHEADWLQVGNTEAELSKLAAAPTGVIWHLHGALDLPAERSKLILTDHDYDDLYIKHHRVADRLRGLLTDRRIIAVGFGMTDPEVLRVFREIGMYANPARPVFAFVGGAGGRENRQFRADLLTDHNVEVIPYGTSTDDISSLHDLIPAYGSFVVTRKLVYQGQVPPTPRMDAEATGLLLYNRLCLNTDTSVGGVAFDLLARARILATLKSNGPQSLSELLESLTVPLALIAGGPVTESSGEGVRNALAELIAEGLVVESTRIVGALELSEPAQILASDSAAHAALIREKFAASIIARATQALHPSDPEEAVNRVAQAAQAFFQETIKERALGVAMAVIRFRDPDQDYHLVALLRHLPEFMPSLASQREAIALTKVVRGLLSGPAESERQHLGLLLQAQFGAHLLGMDAVTFERRARIFADTAFLVDAPSLIPLLAVGCPNHEAARLMVDRLLALGSELATIPLLARETGEHADWALRTVGKPSSDGGLAAFESATGHVGNGGNEFVEGFTDCVNRGLCPPDMSIYLRDVCGLDLVGGACTNESVERAIKAAGVSVRHPSAIPGFNQVMQAEIDEAAERIALERRASYTHARQVQAEAEALLIIQGIRDRRLQLNDSANAFFLSPTRAIDRVAGGAVPITMRPESVLQWAATLAPTSTGELGTLIDQLLADMAQSGVRLLSEDKLVNTFGLLVRACREQLDQFIEENQVLLAQRWGENAAQAFREVHDLSVPAVLQTLHEIERQSLAAQVEELRKARDAAAETKRLSKREREELERLKERERQRSKKHKRRTARTASAKPKRRKKG